LLEDKKEQLEKAMKFYNVEQSKMANQRVNYETQLKKLRNEQKDFELQRKRAKEQIDK
jgi:hypothetical protein